MRVELSCVAELYADPEFEGMVSEYAQYAIKALPAPQYKQADYEAIERLGVLVPFRVVHEGHLIGFASIVEAKVPHYGLKLSVVESLFVMRAFRPTGAGVRLIKTVEKFAKASGSVGIFINCPIHGELFDILPRMDYSLETYNFFKRL